VTLFQSSSRHLFRVVRLEIFMAMNIQVMVLKMEAAWPYETLK